MWTEKKAELRKKNEEMQYVVWLWRIKEAGARTTSVNIWRQKTG